MQRITDFGEGNIVAQLLKRDCDILLCRALVISNLSDAEVLCT